jgi:hypothetical protein
MINHHFPVSESKSSSKLPQVRLWSHFMIPKNIKSNAWKLNFNIIKNVSTLDLHFSWHAKVFNLGHPRKTCCSPRFRCSRLLYCHRVLEGNMMHCRWRSDPKIGRSDIIDQAILTALDDYQFSSVYDLAKKTYILHTMVWQRLTNSIGLAVKHFRWLSHKLNDLKLAARGQMLNKLLRIVYSAEYQSWQYFITLDES